MNDRVVIKTYLVVYNSPAQMRVVSEMLEASSGKEAINILKQRYKQYYEPLIVFNIVDLD